jgi:hypothetical protein
MIVILPLAPTTFALRAFAVKTFALTTFVVMPIALIFVLTTCVLMPISLPFILTFVLAGFAPKLVGKNLFL